MALATYADLLASVANLLHRTDLTASLPDFVALAEARFNRELRTRYQESSVTGTAATTVSLPADFLEVRSLSIVQSWGDKILRPVTLTEAREAGYTDTPAMYALTGTSVVIAPTPSTTMTYRLDYYSKIPALSTAGVNWLLTNYPDIYLYGALFEAAVFLRDVELAQGFETIVSSRMGALITHDDDSRFGNQLVMRSDVMMRA